MAAPADALGPALVGRDGELDVVGAFLDSVAVGNAGTLLVTGDPGVGKTTLVQAACSAVASEALVLTGTCLPLTSMTVPFLALRSAVRAMPRVSGLVRPTMLDAEDATSHVPVEFDRWLGRLSEDRLVILVIDDLHWADRSTLDVLMYLIAGPADRRLAVVATMRGGEVVDGHPLQRWLADIRRFPRIQELTIGPLDRIATAEQIAAVLGGSPHQSLVAEVFAHTRGNAYLNRLAVAGLQPDARHLSAELPADLKSAVLQSWRRLSPAGRRVSQMVAVSGRPVRLRELDEVLDGAPDTDHLADALHEAVEKGILDLAPSGTYWFHHPLNAEVLEQDLTDEERRRWHSAFADHQERAIAAAKDPDVETMVSVADHHFQAGHLAPAYAWALRASEAVGLVGGVSEMLRLLRRAVALRRQLPDAVESNRDLLERLRTAAAEGGEHEDELEAVDALLEVVDEDLAPLEVAELMVRRMHLRFSTGREFLSVADMREAVRVASSDPTSWQYALALAELVHAALWQEESGVKEDAERALAVAKAAGNPRALSYALAANAMVAIFGRHSDEGRAYAVEAREASVVARDFWAFVHASLWEANAQEMWSSELYAKLMRLRREELVALGAPHAYIAKLSADEASAYLAIGNWRECLLRLRVVLGSDPGPLADVSARLTAARLAAWQGRHSEAAAHLARADELFAATSEFLNYDFDAIRADVFLAAGQPQAAYESAMAGALLPGTPPTMSEWLIPLASRALADQIVMVRDAGRDPSELLARLDDLVERFPEIIRDVGESTELWDLQIAALSRLYEAEVGRARRDAGNGGQWLRAAEACRRGKLAWEEVYACWRGTESLLTHGHQQRDAATTLLRRGVELAEELQAVPIRASLAELAASARIPLARVADSAPVPGAIPGLTPREREILTRVVAGRTYSEIARELVISEKTVSSHISNLLRKTGTSNRFDLSRLAMHRSS
jgi:DNA-binding CsgD family transcriptional regulator